MNYDMTFDADALRGDFGPEELALDDWLDDLGPYVTLPADDIADDEDET